ncbi:MAG TPA: sulfate ABC transporter substrate-binding protein [Chloroflexota bacterium]|nr:sulfate ABC transporter substrate-binding protein [Chloroflexota bacterium]HUM68432.1 sulfate ABC transporter substrate-binding protein [Chloroflexota bacterium]
MNKLDIYKSRQSAVHWILAAILLLGLAACGDGAETGGNKPIRLILGAYTTPREAYREIIPLFQAHWKEQTGQDVVFEESYLGSGAQSRAVLEGFEADVIALSLEADVTRLADAGLITHDWKSVGSDGMVSDSVVVFGVRPGNPLDITDWHDLARPGVEVLTPNPKTSGGAMWNILSLYGAAKRGFVDGVPANDDAAATAFLRAVLQNVSVMDKGARESITNYEQGVGEVIITYENEILVGQKMGENYEMVFPRSSILIENPVAVVDTYVDKHGTREVAEAFVQFLFTKEAQEVFASHGLRSVDDEVATATAAQYPPLDDIFTIDYFGGWAEATATFFGADGIFTNIFATLNVPSTE